MYFINQSSTVSKIVHEADFVKKKKMVHRAAVKNCTGTGPKRNSCKPKIPPPPPTPLPHQFSNVRP